MSFIDVLITCPDPTIATAIARASVQERLAACASIGASVTSIYRWNGAVETAEEITLTLKTRAALFERLCARVKALHPYEVPCIIAMDLVKLEPAYADWLGAETD